MHVTKRKLITALIIFGVLLAIAAAIMSKNPEAKRQAALNKPLLQVESQIILARPFQFKIHSFGTVQPRTQSLLVAQISGQIIAVNPLFRDGGFVNKGDVLISIDDRDFLSAVKMAQANLLQAELTLEEEKAKSAQAARDWSRLGDGTKAPDLVLRKPQLAAAEAEVLSAQANLEKAEINLDRTRVKAPYDGRILSTNVDVGQYVNSGSELAELFATDVVEIRLPLKNNELDLIDLPENYRGQKIAAEQFPDVLIHNNLGSNRAEPMQQWPGKIVRTEAAIDSNSHQLYVVAQIQDPFAIENRDKTPLKIGQYVTATIDGKYLTEALVIPTKSLYQGSYVYAIDNNSLLRRHDVETLFQTTTETVIASGIENGVEIVTSPLGQVASGTRVASKRADQQEKTQNEITP